jgi:hypothetical protein
MHYGGQIKENEMVLVCSIQGIDENTYKMLVGRFKRDFSTLKTQEKVEG